MKKIYKIFLAAVIVIIFAAVTVFGYSMADDYDANSFIIRINYRNYEYNWHYGDDYYNVQIFKDSENGKYLIGAGRSTVYPSTLRMHNLTRPEYGLIMFGIKDIVKLKEHANESTLNVHSVSISLTDNDTVSCYMESEDNSAKIFAFFVTGLVYIKSHYIFVFMFFALYFIVLRSLSKKYFAGTHMGLAGRMLYLSRKAHMQTEFLIFNIAVMLLTDCFAHTEAAAHIINILYTGFYGMCSDIFAFVFPQFTRRPRGINIFVWLLFVLIQLRSLKRITAGEGKFGRYIAAYLPPSLILLALQIFIFQKLMGEEGKYAAGLYNFVINFIGINGAAYVHPRIVCFAWFFILGLLLFMLFGKKANPDVRKNFAWSSVFAFAAAFMCCLSVYNADLGAHIIYYLNNLIDTGIE